MGKDTGVIQKIDDEHSSREDRKETDGYEIF